MYISLAYAYYIYITITIHITFQKISHNDTQLSWISTLHLQTLSYLQTNPIIMFPLFVVFFHVFFHQTTKEPPIIPDTIFQPTNQPTNPGYLKGLQGVQLINTKTLRICTFRLHDALPGRLREARSASSTPKNINTISKSQKTWFIARLPR